MKMLTSIKRQTLPSNNVTSISEQIRSCGSQRIPRTTTISVPRAQTYGDSHDKQK